MNRYSDERRRAFEALAEALARALAIQREKPQLTRIAALNLAITMMELEQQDRKI